MNRYEAKQVANRYVGALGIGGMGPKGPLWEFQVAETKPPHKSKRISKGSYRETQKARTAERDKLMRYFMGKD